MYLVSKAYGRPVHLPIARQVADDVRVGQPIGGEARIRSARHIPDVHRIRAGDVPSPEASPRKATRCKASAPIAATGAAVERHAGEVQQVLRLVERRAGHRRRQTAQHDAGAVGGQGGRGAEVDHGGARRRFDDPSSVNVAPLVAARCGSTVTPLTVRRVGSYVSVNWPDVTPPVDVPAMSEMGMPRAVVYVPPPQTPRPDAAVKVKLALGRGNDHPVAVVARSRRAGDGHRLVCRQATGHRGIDGHGRARLGNPVQGHRATGGTAQAGRCGGVGEGRGGGHGRDRKGAVEAVLAHAGDDHLLVHPQVIGRSGGDGHGLARRPTLIPRRSRCSSSRSSQSARRRWSR